MKSNSLIIMAFVILVPLIGCAEQGKVKENVESVQPMTDRIDKAHGGNQKFRTFIVYQSDTPPDGHIEFGDGFRIEKTQGNYFLKPLSTLQTRWGVDDSFKVTLTKVGTGQDSMLCGVVTLPGHDAETAEHGLLISMKSPGSINADNRLEVKYENVNVNPDFCTSAGTHLGRVHAEN